MARCLACSTCIRSSTPVPVPAFSLISPDPSDAAASACTSFLGCRPKPRRRIEIFFINQLLQPQVECCLRLFERSSLAATSQVQSKLLKFLFKVLYAHAMASPASSGPHPPKASLPNPPPCNFKGSCCCCCCNCMFALKTHFVCPADPQPSNHSAQTMTTPMPMMRTSAAC